MPQELLAIGGDDPPEAFELAGSVPPVTAQTDRTKPSILCAQARGTPIRPKLNATDQAPSMSAYSTAA